MTGTHDVQRSGTSGVVLHRQPNRLSRADQSYVWLHCFSRQRINCAEEIYLHHNETSGQSRGGVFINLYFIRSTITALTSSIRLYDWRRNHDSCLRPERPSPSLNGCKENDDSKWIDLISSCRNKQSTEVK